MAGPGDIRAGGAYVELSAPDDKLSRDLQEAEAKVRQYGRSVRTLLAQADKAEEMGQSGRAAALRELAQRQTTNQAQAMQSAKVAQRAVVVDHAHAEAIVENQQRTLQAKRAAAAQLVTDQQDLEDRLFRTQSTGKQIALRDLDRHFASLRARYQGNAKMLLLIERSYQAESASINKQYGSGGLLSALGGKKLVKQELKYTAANMAGAHGGEVGLGIATLLSMSGTAMAIAAPLMLVGAAYSGAQENAAKLAETQNRLNVATQHYKDIVEDMNRGDNTATGNAAAQAAHEADLKAKEIDGLIKKAQADYGITAKLGDVWGAIFSGQDMTTLERQKLDLQAERRKHWERGDALRGLAGAEAQGVQLAKEADYGFKHRERIVGAMDAGQGQDMARLDIERDRGRFAIDNRHRSEWFAAWIIEDERKKAERMKEIDAERNKALADLDEEMYYKRQEIRKKYEKADKDRDKEFIGIKKQSYDKLYTLTGDTGGRIMAERKLEWAQIEEKLTKPISEGGLGKSRNGSDVKWAKKLFEAGNAAQDTYPLTQQIEEIDRRLAVSRGQMTQREASRQEILSQYPQADNGVVSKLLDRMTALNTQWTSMGTFSASEASRMGGGTGDLSAMRNATESVAKDMPRLIQAVLDSVPKFI